MSQNIRRLTGLSLLTALIVVLSLVGAFIKIGPFAISLSLAPIIIGSALYGWKGGTYLGGAFGVVVTLTCITGWDIGGSILWNVAPLLTALICIGKGALAGLVSGQVYHLVAKKQQMLGAIVAGIVCPLVNTTIFILGLYFCFYDTLVAWSGGTDLMVYVLTGLVGFNFLVEVAINMTLSSVIVRVVNVRRMALSRATL